MRTFGTDVDNLILEEYHAGINRYNVILYHNGKKIDPYIKKLTVHFMGNPVPFGNISKHYFELNTDYMDFLEKDEVEVRIEKNSVEIKVCTFYIKTINKGEYMASYTAFSSLLEPEKIALYKIDEDPEWRVAWNNSAKTIKEILDIFLKPANLAMAEYPSYDGTFVSLHADWENMTLSQLICACGILEGCNYVLIGNTFYPVRPSKAVVKSYDIGECVYSENLWQRKTDLCCGKLYVGIKVWEYENYTSEDPLMGSVVSFMESSIEYNNPSSGTGVISANFPLIPGENSSKIKEYMISKLSPFIGMDMNSYTIEYLGDAFIEPGDKVKFYDDSRLVQFYPSEIIWEWDGGLRCTLKSEIVQESGTTEAEVSLKEIVNTINSVANTLQNVRYNSVTTKTLEADAANIGLLKAEQADIKYATIQSLNATDAKITALDSATIKTDELYSKVADLDYIKSDHADIAVIKNTMITTDTLKAEIAKIGYLTADEADIRYLTVSTADTKYLHADMSDMDIAKIQTLFATAGIVSDMTIKDGHITGVLDSVTVNANSITTGTLSVDRLIIRGSEKSLVYELNNISGALQAKSVDTLNGEILTQRTITADKLVAKSITSNEIKAGTITANEIAAGTITASQINMTNLVGNSAFINAISSNSVVVGLRTDLDGISVGGRNLVKGTSETLITCNYPSSSYINAFDTKATKALKAGKYTMSFYAKSTVDGDKIYCFLYSPNNVTHIENSQGLHDSRNDGQSFIVLSTTLKKYWVTFTVNEYDRAPSVLFGRLYCGDGTGTVSIGSCKFEEGTKPTDWTPAPEDVDSLISAAQNTANTANSLAGTANTTANSAVFTIGKWCYNNDVTYINGGKIYTGTVDTDQLKANAVTAEKINVSSLSAISANIGTVTAGIIRSTNYVKDTSGMQLDLSNGIWDSKYTKIDSRGKITCSNILFTPSLVSGDYEYFRAISDSNEIMSCSLHHWNNRMWIDLINKDVKQMTTISNKSLHVYAMSPTTPDAYHQIAGFGTTRDSDNTDLGYIELAYRKADNSHLRWEICPDSKTGNLCAYVEELDNNIKASLTTDGTFKATDIRTYSGVSLSSLNSSTYKNSGGLFNTATALLINGNALNSQWAQMAIEYNGLYFGIRNDGGNTYFMPGNSNGWYDCYSYVGSDGQWHFANNVYLPGTLQANGLNMPSRTGTQTTAKPNCYIDTNGTFYKTSTASSRSVKDDIKLLESEELNPSRLYDVSIYQFKYKTTYLSNKEDTRYKKDMIGFILENLHEKYPIAVDCHMDEAGKIIYDSWNEQYLIPAMLKLIQDQHNELINQSMKIQNLEIRLLFMNA